MPLRQPALSGPERAEAAYKWSYNNPLNFIDPSGHCATNPDGTPDISTDPECWYQYNWILDTIFDGDISLIGTGKDWSLLYSDQLILKDTTETKTEFTLMEYLGMRKVFYDRTGYYCDSITCMYEGIVPGGELESLIPAEWICGIVAIFSGAPRACSLLDTGNDLKTCITDGLYDCVTNMLVEKLIGENIPGNDYLESKSGIGIGDWISGEPTGMFDALTQSLSVIVEALDNLFAPPPVYAPSESDID